MNNWIRVIKKIKRNITKDYSKVIRYEIKKSRIERKRLFKKRIV